MMAADSAGSTPPGPPRGVVDRIISAYAGMRRETLDLYQTRPSEGVILSFLMIAGLAVFAGGVVELLLTGGPDGRAQLVGQAGPLLIGAFVLLPLGAYLLSVIMTPILRGFGGSGGFYETRLALGWSAAVAFPLILIISVFNVIGHQQMISPLANFTLNVAPSALWVYLLASAMAALHGFRSARRLLGPAALVAAVVVVAFIYLGDV